MIYIVKLYFEVIYKWHVSNIIFIIIFDNSVNEKIIQRYIILGCIINIE